MKTKTENPDSLFYNARYSGDSGVLGYSIPDSQSPVRSLRQMRPTADRGAGELWARDWADA